jgi:hypothetical protein
MNVNDQLDFAISYAGEQEDIAREINTRFREHGFTVFFAPQSIAALIGEDGESVFRHMFSQAKEVVVLLSQHYTQKEWTRYEWDIIRKRNNINRFIPIRIDDSEILGLPSNIICIPFKDGNFEEIVCYCEKKLLLYEKTQGFHRQTEYERILAAIISEDKGDLSKAYQLVNDRRTRPPLDDCVIPKGQVRYKLAKPEKWYPYGVIKRLEVKIILPKKTTTEQIRFNLMHCASYFFNVYKPDAIMVYAYFDKGAKTDVNSDYYTAGRAIFAPYGKWEEAEAGFVYHLPTSEFEFSIDIK